MGINSDILDKIRESGYSNDLNAGWSSISPCINYSKREMQTISSLGSGNISTINDIEKITFGIQSIDVELQKDNIEIIYIWKFITEKRKNELMTLRMNMKFDGSKMSIEASLSELEAAYENIMEILNARPDMCNIENYDMKSDIDFIQVFVKELLDRLLKYLTMVNDREIYKHIIESLVHFTTG